MFYLKYVIFNRFSLKILLEASDVVASGGLIVFPTDTVYGLGGDPFNLRTIRRVFEVKHRASRPLPILVSDLNVAYTLGVFNDYAVTLSEKFWPGPLTLIVPSKAVVPEELTLGLSSVGLRMPNHNIALNLIDYCGGSLIGTSANISGGRAPKTASDALSQLGLDVDYFLDAGPCPIGFSSTVVDVSISPPKFVREGSIKKEEIEDILGIELS